MISFHQLKPTKNKKVNFGVPDLEEGHRRNLEANINNKSHSKNISLTNLRVHIRRHGGGVQQSRVPFAQRFFVPEAQIHVLSLPAQKMR